MDLAVGIARKHRDAAAAAAIFVQVLPRERETHRMPQERGTVDQSANPPLPSPVA